MVTPRTATPAMPAIQASPVARGATKNIMNKASQDLLEDLQCKANILVYIATPVVNPYTNNTTTAAKYTV
eukprot:8688400-Ditylum_brightwellii.AAC.1